MQSLSPRQQLVLTRTHQAALLRREKGQRRHQRSALAAQFHADWQKADHRLRSLETELETILRRQRDERSIRAPRSPLKPAVGRLRKQLAERTEFVQTLRDSLGERTGSPRVYKGKPRAELVVVAGEVMPMHILGEGELVTAVSQQMGKSGWFSGRGLNLSLPEEAVLEDLEPVGVQEFHSLSTREMKMELKPVESDFQKPQVLLKPVESDFREPQVLLKPVNVVQPAAKRETTTENGSRSGFQSDLPTTKKARKTRSLLSKSQAAVDSQPSPNPKPSEAQVSHSISVAVSLHSADQPPFPPDLPDSTKSQGLPGRMVRYYKERVKPDFSPKVLRTFFAVLPDSAQEAELRRKLSTLQRVRLQELPKSFQ